MKNPAPNAVYRINSSGRPAKVEEYDPSAMVIKTLTPDMTLTDEQRSMLDEAAKHPIVYEDDCPELTPEMIEKYKRAARIRDERKKKTAN